MAGTKAQTGLSITRDGNKFGFSWKLAETYKSQIYRARIGTGAWPAWSTIGPKVTSKSISINKNNYYPNTKQKLSAVAFVLKATAEKKTLSAEARKDFEIKIPANPSVTCTPSDSLNNVTTFSWNVNVNEKNGQIFTDVEYQSILVAESNESDGSKLRWSSSVAGWITGTGTASNSRTITETSSTIATGSHTRWFRVRSRGPRGASAWRYTKRVYAQPNKAIIKSVTVSDKSQGKNVLVNWTQAASNAYPCAEMTVQSWAGVPAANITVPSGSTWTDKLRVKRISAANAATYTHDAVLGEDEVLFTRIMSHHLVQDNESAAYLTAVGRLKAPVITELTPSSDYKIVVEVENKSQITDSFIAIVYKAASNPNNLLVVGVIPAGSTTATVQCPDWSQETAYSIGIYAAVGSYQAQTRADGVGSYSIDAKMTSVTTWDNGQVPKPPQSVEVNPTDISGTIQVTWDWSWADAQTTVISWADHPDAWESTEEPDDFDVTNINAAQWNISGLETGKKWYIRLRFRRETSDATIFSDWSEMVEIDLSSAPAIPVLTLSSGVITDSVTAYWGYVSTDGTAQAFAEICEAEITSQGIVYGNKIAETQTAQHITIYAEEVGWQAGETHLLCVRVVSGSGKFSDGWSDPVPVQVANPIYATVTNMSLVEETVTEGDEELTLYLLKAMPLGITVTGAGDGGVTSIIIERAEDYHVDRPDETDFNGFEGETIAIFTQSGEAPITIERGDLFGRLDDGANYRLIATVQDSFGQSDEVIIPFTVMWDHQAVKPEGTAYIDGTIAIINPVAPEGYAVGDSCDIYRLSANRPELIFEGATFGETYVDPYPAIGEFGGHRIVYKTADGDYITEDNEIAWLDLGKAEGDNLDLMHSLIDFDGNQIVLFYDTSASMQWEKDFRETKYLGGAIQGDWNQGIGLSSSVDSSMVILEDAESIRLMRKLALYTGICHIRTLDGSSYACDIQVSEDRDFGGDRLRAKFGLSITRVDPQGFEGMTLQEYETE